MEQNIEHDKSKQALKNSIFVEPATRKVRPYLIEYVSLLIAEAKSLPEGKLLGSSGNEIATDICGALAWQDADGIENDSWFNRDNEPVLSQILDIAGTLDADANHLDKWQQLFKLANRIG